MQSLLRRAWPHEQSDKKPEKALLPNPKMRPSPIVEIPPLFRMKRKRGDSPDRSLSPHQEHPKKMKYSEAERPVQSLPVDGKIGGQVKEGRLVENGGEAQSYHVLPVVDAETPKSISPSNSLSTTAMHSDHSNKEASENMAPQQADQPSERTKVDGAGETQAPELRQIIEHQVNLEILIKHRELRLIEQELAKCQTALEQLRRCELIPYPGTTGLAEAVSAGTGPSLRAPPGLTQPQAPAPWGVIDGPYTRHYSRWLLNDPTFDPVPFQQMQAQADYFSATPEGRSTRNSGAGLGRSGKSRASRDSAGNFGNALPNYPMVSRGKGGPLVIKRMADNQFVKLICNNCQRGDFSSVQGFLNHCRIAHKVDYKSHEAAATDCGRPLEDDESHLIPATTTAAIPVARTGVPKTPAPAAQPSPTGFVHPLNAPTMPRYTWKVQAAAARAAAATEPRKSQMSSTESSTSNTKSFPPIAHQFHSAPLVASHTTPYLSAQFAKRGLGGDLQHVAARARERVDLGPDVVDDDETVPAPSRKPSLSKAVSGATVARFGASAGNSQLGRSQSRKGQHAPLSRPRPAPLAPQKANMHAGSMEIPESPQDPNLSPHTADSNPGLVSDHEDDDAVSELDEARSERHESPASTVTQLGALRRGMGDCGADTMDVDVEAEEDVDGHHGVLIRPRGLAFQEFAQRPTGGSAQRPLGRFGEAAK